jgi:hypothetical protein
LEENCDRHKQGFKIQGTNFYEGKTISNSEVNAETWDRIRRELSVARGAVQLRFIGLGVIHCYGQFGSAQCADIRVH